jgi:hypothetical protein
MIIFYPGLRGRSFQKYKEQTYQHCGVIHNNIIEPIYSVAYLTVSHCRYTVHTSTTEVELSPYEFELRVSTFPYMTEMEIIFFCAQPVNESDERRVWTFRCDTLEEKEMWMQAFDQATH